MASILVIKANAYDQAGATLVIAAVLGLFGLWRAIALLVREIKKGKG